MATGKDFLPSMLRCDPRSRERKAKRKYAITSIDYGDSLFIRFLFFCDGNNKIRRIFRLEFFSGGSLTLGKIVSGRSKTAALGDACLSKDLYFKTSTL